MAGCKKVDVQFSAPHLGWFVKISGDESVATDVGRLSDVSRAAAAAHGNTMDLVGSICVVGMQWADTFRDTSRQLCRCYWWIAGTKPTDWSVSCIGEAFIVSAKAQRLDDLGVVAEGRVPIQGQVVTHEANVMSKQDAEAFPEERVYHA